jgi:homocysteine S-methyltransferase
MSEFKALQERLDRGEVVILDGAIGTQLQEMGLPIYRTAWAATALHTHPATVQLMHEAYVKAGVDIITTNTYASARHNLEPLGLGELTGELNRRAVLLAREARDTASGGRPVLIAGSISNFGMVTEGESIRSLHDRSRYTADQQQANLREQAALLTEAGVDFLLAESTGSNTHRKWVSDACKSAGIPFWVGFKVHREPDDKAVRTGYRSADRFEDALPEIMSHGGAALSVFHSGMDDTTAALKIALDKWPGVVGAYPDAERNDYMAPAHDHSVTNRYSVEEFVGHARGWVEMGVQIIGGCCGYGPAYIRPLRDALPARIAQPRRG